MRFRRIRTSASPPMSKQFWLLKTEGDVYPITALKRDGKSPWTGVRNFAARNFMRDKMKVGDLCLFYHSSSAQNGVYGTAKVASKAYPDLTQFDKKSDYFEPRATKEKPYWWLVDITFVKEYKKPVLATEMRGDPKLAGMILWKVPRLSIQPVSPAHFKYIGALAR